MAKFRKKPVEIEAWLVEELLSLASLNWDGLPQRIRDAYEAGDIVFTNKYISIKTLEGVHRADLDDMVICGVKGELYPCKPDIFELTYDKVVEPS